uniref:Uncharacterized protein n=1 Tax=Candidatus Kentrum sp. FM TaxID=2126340 RepID=A0A450TI43_9GAMM
MRAIAGIIDYDRPIDRSELERMRTALFAVLVVRSILISMLMEIISARMQGAHAR